FLSLSSSDAIPLEASSSMLSERIPQDQIPSALASNMIDVLTIIPINEIADKWDSSWRYFKNTWMNHLDGDLWNVNNMQVAGIDLANRTNNPFERYNRTLGELFSVTFSSLLAFVETAKADARRYAQMIDDIKHQHRYRRRHAEFVEPRMWGDYLHLE
ncbi:hypothetical protein F442_00252, partial [Phytophthora nicotianae P10297]